MPKGQYTRKQGLKRNRLTPAEKATRAFSMGLKAKRARPTIAHVGVGGAVARMSKGVQQAPEVKTLDLQIAVAPTTASWSLLITAPLAAITLGTGSSERIGRNIRVVGLVMRAVANTDQVLPNTAGLPFTIDMIWDKQSNGIQAPFNSIYAQIDANGLPNSNNTHRFEWLKRYTWQGGTQASHIVNQTVKCNKLISYDASTGFVGDIEKNNLILCWSGVDPSPSMTGYLRIMYTDA